MSPESKKIKLIVLVFIFYGTSQGVLATKPEIIPAQSWSPVEEGVFQIREGDELRIECQGEGVPLQFSGPRIIGNIQQAQRVISNPSNPGMYELIRYDAIPEDTGWYGCAEEGIEIQNDDQTIDHPDEDISWIYIYVNSPTPFAILDKSDDPYLRAVPGGRVVVPCRPTSPDLDVILYKSFILETVGGNLTYDPKIGFIMHYVDGADALAQLECGIDGTDLESMPSFELHIEDVEQISNSDVKTDALVRGTMGENLTLHCNIAVTRGTYITLRWETPNFDAKDRLSNFSHSSYEDEKTIWQQDLTITNAEIGDSGEYVCVATHSSDTARSSTNVTIIDPSQPFIFHKVEGNSSILAAENGNATWELTIDGYPIPLIEWYKGEDRIDTEGSDSSNKYSHSIDKMKIHFYKISDLDINDNGNYTIRITENTATSEAPIVIPLQLMVEVKPVIAIHNHSQIYEPGRIAVLSCNATGSPRPNVSWTFSEWTPEENVESTLPPDITSEHERRGTFSVLSHIKLPISSMGNLTCTACNTVGCTDVTEPIFVSDGDGFFGIVNRGLQSVTEGDDLTLICAASLFNYTDNIQWVFENSTGPEPFDPRISIENDKTNFTWQSILEIRDVQRSDAGNYQCQAESTSESNVTKFYDLVVYGALEASLIDTNMNNSDMHVNTAGAYSSRNLTCLAQGRPKPIVTWRKNGQPLNESDTRYTLSEDNSTLSILFFDQSGNYTCIAKNRLNSVERYVNIIVEEKPDNTTTWVSLICVLIIIIVIVITYMGIKVHQERILRKELHDAGLTHFEEGAVECLNPDLTVDDQAELLPYDKKWEFPRELLKLGKQLGSGAFGVVMKAEARGIVVEGEVTTVAVKMVRRSADPSYMKALSSELKIMIHLGRHLNVVNLLGACTKTIITKRELYVIVEYCRFGNLHNYLQRNRAIFIDQIDPSTQKIDPSIGLELLVMSEDIGSPTSTRFGSVPFSRSTSGISSMSNSGIESIYYNNRTDSGDINMSPDGGILSNNSVQPGWRSNYKGDYRYQNLKPICTQDVLCWAWQVSCGMKYLSARNVLHGDLAARNILLADDNVVKICDFGLAKNMYKDNNYKKRGDCPLPIKWMAIESIRDRIFSTQSDVWSFGIVLWEFFTLSQIPYPGMEADTQYEKLLGGYRLEKPEYATEEIYNVMLHCWRANPSLRPTFPELVDKLGGLLNEGITMHYFEMNSPYVDMNNLALQNGKNDYLNMMSAPTHDCHNSPDPGSASPGSDYLPMSPIGRTNEPRIFSPRVKGDGIPFGFPSSEGNVSNPSEPGYYVKPAPPLGNGSPDEILVDFTQEINDPIKSGNAERALTKGETGSSKVANSSNYTSLGNPSSNNRKDSDQNLNEVNCQKNNNKHSSSPGIGEDKNYVNLPKNKPCPPKDTVEGFTNPSYVLMSAITEDQ